MSEAGKARMLSNVRVLDLGRVIAAPFCCRILADLGAEVLKVENISGDLVRGHPPYYGGFSAIFAQYNVGKKGICIDMRSSKGIELLKKLVAASDVVVENFRPGIMQEMGLGYETLREINNEIILCSISGFGQTGPERDRPAFTDVIMAYSGMDYMAMKMQQDTGGGPPGFPCSFADTYGGINAALAILAALIHRQSGGGGQAIDISLLDCILSSIDHTLQGFIFSDGALDGPPMVKPPIRMKDGYMAMTPMVSFKGIVKAMGRPELAADERFSVDDVRIDRYTEESMKIIKDWAINVTIEEASRLLERHGVPYSKVNSLSEVVNAPVVRERKMLVPMEIDRSLAPTLILNTPARFSQCETGPQGRPPYLGEHNWTVFRDLLGFTEDEIRALQEEGVIYHDQNHETDFAKQ